MDVVATKALNTKHEMPAVGLGVWQMAEGREVRRAVTSALGSGYRLIDTARIYGNEIGVGEAIRQSDIDRSEIFLTTKLWNDDHGYHEARRGIEGSLGRLNVDYLDLYLIHWPDGGKRVETWQAMEEFQGEGKVRSIGVSNFEIEHLEELAAAGLSVPAVNQIKFHPFVYGKQRELLEYCRENGIVVEAYSPLARARQMDEEILRTVAERHGKTPAQVMLRWALQHGTVVIPKSANPDRIKQNIDVFDFELTEDEMDRINKLG
jgi:diketogulonate reductase-like aldo/keto reductase